MRVTDYRFPLFWISHNEKEIVSGCLNRLQYPIDFGESFLDVWWNLELLWNWAEALSFIRAALRLGDRPICCRQIWSVAATRTTMRIRVQVRGAFPAHQTYPERPKSSALQRQYSMYLGIGRNVSFRAVSKHETMERKLKSYDLVAFHVHWNTRLWLSK